MLFCLFFNLAIIVSSLQTTLFSPLIIKSLALLILCLCILYCHCKKHCHVQRCVLAFVVGLAYANGFATIRLHQQLPEALEKTDLTLTASIASLPDNKGFYQKIVANVIQQPAVFPATDLQKIIINVYQQQDFRPCDIWQFSVRLKRPHGLGNPGGFDYEAYMLEQGIQAKGYVTQARLVSRSEGFCVDELRQSWRDYVLSVLSKDVAAWVIALSIGDNSQLNDEQNSLLQETGTLHLFVISGSHISLCGVAVYAFIMLCRRLGAGRIWNGDWRAFATVFALGAAIFYTLLAGSGLPAQRAIIMLTVFFGGRLFGLQMSLWLRYWFAMFVVLLVNPLAPLNAGFVLSFAAVFILVLIADGVNESRNNPAQRLWLSFKQLLHSQAAITLGLLPVMLLYFSQLSIVAPLVNLIAIPLVSFFIVPTILIALIAWLLSGDDVGLLQCAALQLEPLIAFMSRTNAFFKDNGLGMLHLHVSDMVILVLVIGSMLLLAPRLIYVRYAGVLLLIAAMLSGDDNTLQPNELVMHVLDVDQGLSVVIQTAHHAMVFDVGSAWPDGSMVEMAVAPSLAFLGISHLDKVMISHLDNDHVGAVQDVSRYVSVNDIVSSEPIKTIPFHVCEKGQMWHWDGVTFQVLHPDVADNYAKRNNKSCVLLIEVAGKRVVLPGDIEAQVERKLLEDGLPAIDVLVAAHHGSKTSSTASWVDRVRDGVVIFSSGYLSRFHHPHPSVMERYTSANVRHFTTALQGAIRVKVAADGKMDIASWREEKGKYWNKINRIDNNSRG